MSWPRRVVCMTEESVETLYLLGRQDLVVGVSGYTVRPPEVRQKPRVCAFTSADVPKILALKPDLAIGFSDLQADIARDLIKAGVNVVIFNQRSIEEVLGVVKATGALVGAAAEAEALAAKLAKGVEDAKRQAASLRKRPKVYFEEWDEPMISGIRWVEELIEAAGGQPIFPELKEKGLAKDRIVTAAEVIKRRPDLIVASWCGKKANLKGIAARPGWDAIPAVKNGQVREIKSTYILQPGPAALTDGLSQLQALIKDAAGL